MDDARPRAPGELRLLVEKRRQPAEPLAVNELVVKARDRCGSSSITTIEGEEAEQRGHEASVDIHRPVRSQGHTVMTS